MTKGMGFVGGDGTCTQRCVYAVRWAHTQIMESGRRIPHSKSELGNEARLIL